MNIRKYQIDDHAACMEIIKSNTPLYFAVDEVPLFEAWLVAQEKGLLAHPVSEKEYYFIIEEGNKILGCAGYLLRQNSEEIYLSWGMVHHDYQKHGHGKKLLEYRIKSIAQKYPGKKVCLTTTQDIAPFFENYGFKVTHIKPKFYSESLDRYEMEK